VITFDYIFRLSLHGGCLDLLVHQSQLPNIEPIPLLKLSEKLHAIFEPLLILSDFEDKSQYYFPNLNVSGKNWVREQFCHQLDFFYLQTVKKL